MIDAMSSYGINDAGVGAVVAAQACVVELQAADKGGCSISPATAEILKIRMVVPDSASFFIVTSTIDYSNSLVAKERKPCSQICHPQPL